MFLQGRQADAPQEALQVLDIVLRELPTSRSVADWTFIFFCFQCASFLVFIIIFGFFFWIRSYSPVARSFYSPDLGRRQPLGDGLESWRGFYQSIRPTQMGLSLNICNVSELLRVLMLIWITSLDPWKIARKCEGIRYRKINNNIWHITIFIKYIFNKVLCISAYIRRYM